MFKFLFKPKKVQVLVVVNNDASIPVDYYNKIDVKLETEVRAACNALAIPATSEQVASIADMLTRGETYWLEKTWGFQVICVEI